MLLSVSLALLASSAPLARAASFSLIQNWQGSSFFSDWTWYGFNDNTTQGNIFFVNETYSMSQKLTYVNSAGNAIIKMDNFTQIQYNYPRDSVRITSTQGFGLGSLWVMDAVHLPFGCSVWPSFWSESEASIAGSWPAGGEIDTLENVNLATANQYALHTETGCYATSGGMFTGQLTDTNCSSGNAQGCTIVDTNTASYGQAFASGGGGVYATLLVEEGISIWFFPRSSVPSDLSVTDTTVVPDPSTWGTPSASYPAAGCNINQFFSAQHIIFDITACGNDAGINSILGQTCGPIPADATDVTIYPDGYCYFTYVYGNGTGASNYDNAYFEVQYVRVWSNSTTGAAASSSISAASTAAAATGTGAGASPSASSKSGALAGPSGTVGMVLAAVLASVGALALCV